MGTGQHWKIDLDGPVANLSANGPVGTGQHWKIDLGSSNPILKFDLSVIV